jgi:serine protease AprX
MSRRPNLLCGAGFAPLLLLGALGVLLGSGADVASAPPLPELSPELRAKIEPRVIRDLSHDGHAKVMILLSEQADLRAAHAMRDHSARGAFVLRTLRELAERTQPELLGILRRRGAAPRPFFVANVIAARVDRELLRELAERSDVRAIESDAESAGIEPPHILDATPTPDRPGGQLGAEPVIEWGVKSVNADKVWDLGVSGAGIVIANQDTGMDWTHPALKARYRGWDGVRASHDFSWHDSIHDSTSNPCGNDAAAPCDDGSHGTHTTGTVIGDDGAANRIGVAPGARWIGCRNMDRGRGTPARYTECFQFFIAPTDLAGRGADPDRRPHVMNNSWGCDRSEGCAPATLLTVVENTAAAGIFVEASAGNSGPGCGTVDSDPAIFDAAFVTGAYDSLGALARFSSRGAVTADGSGRMKPDLVAPGVRVRSSVPGGRYAAFSGTSMAGPHVVGVVALLWAARPELVRDIAATRKLLIASARPDVKLSAIETCGGLPSDFIPNNSFGAGRIDALAAVTW